ncbi:MAG TPA: glycosyltransferase [Rudaea sp.]|nr:glycosyltransferase [Rudaea sp.]
MWLIDRLRKKAESDTPIINDPSVPLVSVLIRSMDRPCLQRALRSAARQTWGNVEIAVVAACGRSHRPLPDTILGRPVRLVFADDGAPLLRPQAANACIEAARGQWLNFLDDDDELLPEHLTTLLSAPRPGKERVIYATTRANDKNGKPTARVGQPGHHVQLYFHSRATLCAMVFERSLIDEGVRFDPEFLVHEDHDFQIACAQRTQFLFVDAIVSIWNAQVGDSGCGFGANDNPRLRMESVARIRVKWQSTLNRWLRNADALTMAGKFYLDARDFPPALEFLERALTRRGNDANVLNLCAMANLYSGNAARAEALITRALRRLPQHPLLHQNLEKIRTARGA